MALATPELNATNWANALNNIRELFNSITGQTGDLGYDLINNAQVQFADFEVAREGLEVDAAINPTAVENSIASRGGPATNAETATAHANLKTAWDAWEMAVYSAALDPAKNQIVVVNSRAYGRPAYGVTLQTIELNQFIPASFADPLRASAEATAVEDALTALGA